MWVQPLRWEDSLEEEMAIHSSILATDRGSVHRVAQSDTIMKNFCFVSNKSTSIHTCIQAKLFSVVSYWSGLLCPPSGGLPDPGMEPTSLMSPALAGGFFTTGATWELILTCIHT